MYSDESKPGHLTKWALACVLPAVHTNCLLWTAVHSKINFIFASVHVCMHVYHVHAQCSWESEEGFRHPASGVRDGHEHSARTANAANHGDFSLAPVLDWLWTLFHTIIKTCNSVVEFLIITRRRGRRDRGMNYGSLWEQNTNISLHQPHSTLCMMWCWERCVCVRACAYVCVCVHVLQCWVNPRPCTH